MHDPVYVAFLDESMECLLGETLNKALLDCGCTKTVCGEVWLKCYLESLTEDELKRIYQEESCSRFKFGDNKLITANRRLIIPCIIANKQVMLNNRSY